MSTPAEPDVDESDIQITPAATGHTGGFALSLDAADGQQTPDEAVDYGRIAASMPHVDSAQLDVPLHQSSSVVSTTSESSYNPPIDEAYVPKTLKTMLGTGGQIKQVTAKEVAKRLEEHTPESPPYERTFGGGRGDGRESRVLVLYTGGTIGMCMRNGVYEPKSEFLLQSLHSVPYLNDTDYVDRHYPTDNPNYPKPMCLPPVKYVDRRIVYWLLEYHPLLDSSDMTFDDWIRIAKDIHKAYSKYDGFVVLHGTDTLAYTASALSFMFEYLGKPVVLTGAQIPVCEVRSDGQENLIGALVAAGSMDIPEVCIYFNNKLLRGNRCSKVDNSALDAFNSPNMDPLVRMDIKFKIDYDSIFRCADVQPFRVHTVLERHVGVLRIFPSMSIDMVRAFVAPPTAGVVLQTFGAGNVSSRRADIIEALREAVERGCIIVNCSQCVRGEVDIHYATGQVLAEIGVIGGGDMTIECALTKLSYVLGKQWPVEQRRKMMRKNIRGELTTHVRASDTSPSATLPELDVLPRLVKFLRLGTAAEVTALKDALTAPLACAAAGNNDAAALTALKESGARLNLTDYDMRSPLHVAAHCGAADAVRLLLKYGLNVHSRDRWNLTPLQCAIQGRHLEIIETLVQHGANLGHLSSVFRGMELCHCVARGDTAGLAAWHLAGVSLNTKDDVGRTPLHVAAAQAADLALTMLTWLVECGCDLHQKDRWGRTPLLVAVQCRNTDSIELIRRSGGHVDWPLVRVGVELCSCAADKDTDGLDAWSRAGADLNTADYDGRTALHVASSRNSLTVVKWLLERGVDRFRRDNYGHTALSDAQERSFTQIALALTTSDPS